MTHYIVRRALGLVPTFLILLLLVVVLVRLIPGDIVDILLQEQGGGGSGRSAELALGREQIEARLGLDRPVFVQYVEYAAGLLQGDLGRSLWDDRPVREMILNRVPVTAEVALVAIVVSLLTAIPVGLISAVRQDTPIDYFLRSALILGISLPNFAIATAIVIFPAIWWGWSVSFTYVSLTEDPIKHLTLIIPPAAVLGVQLSASVARMTRTMMLEVMQEDYVRTARSKGLTGSQVVLGHALKNALIPVVTLLGLQVTFLIGGSVITETVFALPGLGRLLLEAIANRDYPVIQGIVVSVGLLVMITNLLIDISYGYLDPRIRYS
ncbi:MAG: ABC transporter permease subunit [Dehalococcoidia bacterium]|nr:ABC transporter permease subunit [Dehalococcoidia bacterium]